MKLSAKTYEGSPCRKYGHTLRYLVGHGCVKCMLEYNKERRTDPVIYRNLLKRNRDWKKENLDRIRPSLRDRKARMRGAEGTFTLQDIELILLEQNNKCPGCLAEFTLFKPYTIDHFIPLNKGGTNYPENIQLLCSSCNCSKKDTLWQDWFK